MNRRLPPFAALRAFEAAARHSNFTKAALELSVSPSAISHQVKQLEEQLGVCLFYRVNGLLELTEPARAYVAEISQAFNLLEVASARIDLNSSSKSLTINLFPSLAASWLLRGLSSFHSANPTVDVRLITSLKPIDFNGSDIDLAIRYLTEPPPRMPSLFLFDEVVFPVCSPGLAAAVGTRPMAGALAQETLIYCDTEPDEWCLWWASQGQPALAQPHQIRVDNRLLAIEAALDGLGVAMARTPYADQYLRAGRLVAPFSKQISTGWKYYLIWPERKAKIDNLVRFVAWAREHCNGARSSALVGAG
jgi:LysR family transcriptional regulator, glycine cleavage system transcriptional activator